MAAGTHYPTEIWAALRKATVLVAVIGPRWLTATDPSGTRLIDREQDWVRRELAFAFTQGITVLPVLLKDTPEDAGQPLPDELPDTVRRLATIQSCTISQRTLGPDLARLGERLAPLLADGRPAAAPPQQAFYSVVNALDDIPSMHDADTRSTVLGQLRPAIAGAVRYSPQRRIHMVNIVRTCLDYPGGLAELIATITQIEGPESLPLRRLVDAAGRLPPEWPGTDQSGLR
jgi:hypothetical protein